MFNKKRDRSPFSSKNCSEDSRNTNMKSMAAKDIFFKTQGNIDVGNTVESSNPSDTTEYEVQRIPSMLFLNESLKKSCNIPEKTLTAKKSPNSTGNSNSAANILAIKNSLSCLKGGMEVLKNDIRRCSSLTDSLKVEKEEFCYPPSHLTGNALPFPRQTLNFKHPSSGYNARHCDYVKEFDSVISNTLYSELQNAYRSSDNPRSVFSLTPHISPASEPIRLKKRTYAYGMLSINNSADISSENVKEDKPNEGEELKTPSEHDEYYSSEEDSRANGRKGSALSGTDNPVYLLKSNKEVNGASSLLIIKAPLRIKCIDEATKSAKEILIYSDEFLSNLRKGNKDGKASEKETFESLVQQCLDYDGKSLRIILDAKNFINSLSISSKQRGNDKKSNSSKNVNHGSEDSARNRAPAKKISDAPFRSMMGVSSRSHLSILNEQQSNRKEISLNKLPIRKKDTVDKAGQVKKSPSEHPFSSRESILNSLRKESTTSVEVNKNEGRNENGRKLRIALKRVNPDEIIASKFRNYFNFYAKFRSRLKSGIAISKMNSNFWLKTCGIIYDPETEKLADDYFEAKAK